MADVSDLAGLAQVMQAVQGGKTKQTKQTKLTPEGITELVNQTLRGESGLGRIGSSAKRAGLYNSTTEELLRNDLISRATVNAGIAGAPTESVTDVEGAGLGSMAALLAGTSLTNYLAKNGIEGLLNAFKGISGLSGGFESLSNALGQSAASNVITGTVPEAANLATSTLSGTGAGATAGGITNALSANAIPGIGGLVSGILQGEDALNPENLLLTGGVPLLLGAGVPGALAALGGTALGSFGGDILGGIGDIGSKIVKGIGKIFSF